MSEQRFDAIVAGAGPAGAATAILLARAGWRVALVERQRFPRRKVCGECIAASNAPLLDALGVGDAFRATAGAELRRVAFWHGDSETIAGLPPADPRACTPRAPVAPSDSLSRGRQRAEVRAPAAHGRALGREVLDTWLVERAAAAGVVVFQPWSLLDLAGSPGAFRCRVRSADGDRAERVLHAALAVAAHGSWEPLPAERAPRRAARRASDLFAFKANFRGVALPPDLLPVLSFRGGYGGMVVADGGLATLAGCIRDDRLAEARGADDGAPAGAVFESILRREVAGVARALAGAVREGPWLASGPLRPGIRLGAGDGIFRVGNAAGEAHPIVGEGISMALQSAFLLADAIAARRDVLLDPGSARTAQGVALARYEVLWRRRFSRRLGVAAAFAHAAMRPALSPALAALVRAWPALLRHGAEWSGKTRTAPEALRAAAG